MNSTRLSDILSIKKGERKKRLLTIGVLVTGILAIAFVIITFYGQYSGNFVISIPDDDVDRGIILSDEPNFINPKSTLLTNPLKDAFDTTYRLINFQEGINTDGNFHDKYNTYLSYSFYIKNTGKETFDVNYFMTIETVTNNLDAAVRVLLIEGNDPTNTNPDNIIETLYQKADTEPYATQEYYASFGLPRATYFATEKQIFSKTIERFIPGQIKRFTFFLWLEGNDPEDNDSIKAGKLKAKLQFEIVQGAALT